MAWTTPIADRTAADLVARNAKAFFNLADWTRVRNNTTEVRALILSLLGVSISAASLSTPTTSTVPAAADVNALIGDIETCRETAALPLSLAPALEHDYVGGPSQIAPDYLDVNDWETVLLNIHGLLANAVDYSIPCGVAAAGQDRFYQNQWR
jgi:hypothetical protein